MKKKQYDPPKTAHDAVFANIEELISIGTVGLIKAICSFAPEKNIKLATYASRCIENEILMYVRKNSGVRCEISIDEPQTVVESAIDDPETVLTVDDILREQGHLPPVEEDVNNERRELLRKKLDEDMTDDELNKLISYLDNCETLQDLYRSIIRAFGQSRGLVVYRAVKKR